MNAVGFDVTRPINDWCADGSIPVQPACGDGTLCPARRAESWDDWGPFYTPMYAQHVGLDGSTVEMCNRTDTLCGLPGSTTHTRGRLGAYQAQYVVTTSSLEYVSANRNEMLFDEAERYRRGVEGEPRVDCCEPSVRRGQQLDEGVPGRVRDPGRHGPAVDAEAKRLVGSCSTESRSRRCGTTPRSTARRSTKGSYVVWMDQAHRGLADTALNVGRRHLRPDQHPLRPARGLEPRLPVGRRHRRDPARRGFSPVTNRINKTRTPTAASSPDGPRPTRSRSTRPRRCGR